MANLAFGLREFERVHIYPFLLSRTTALFVLFLPSTL